MVHPGRAADWNGDELYTRQMEEVIGPSRHLTFIFTAFVFMQIFNMFAARKIHDELNIFEGIHTNFVFIIVLVLIVLGQWVITSYGSRVFVCCLDGLDGTQWGMSIIVGATSLVINLLLKFVPDSAPCVPQIG
jgi:Ca2+-transporting ATPase